MSQAKMTPGPWTMRSNPDDDGRHSHWVDGRPVNDEQLGKPVAEVRRYYDGESDANARAIAALPELIAAATAVLGHAVTIHEPCCEKDVTRLCRILARIDGEEA